MEFPVLRARPRPLLALCVGLLLAMVGATAQAQAPASQGVDEAAWKPAEGHAVAVDVNNGYTYEGTLREVREREVVVIDRYGREFVIQKRDALGMRVTDAAPAAQPEPPPAAKPKAAPAAKPVPAAKAAPADPGTQAPLLGVVSEGTLSNVLQPSRERETLLRRRYRAERLGGPIALIAVGGGLALLGSLVGALAADDARTCRDRRNRFEDFDDRCSKEQKRSLQGISAVGFIIGAAGVGMSIGGGVWVGKRLNARRELRQEIRELRRQRKSSAAPTQQFNVAATPQGVGARWTLRF